MNFGVINEKKEAERAIKALQQKKSATAYIREFQKYSTRTEWGEEALIYAYRKSFKNFIKNKLLYYNRKIEIFE